MPNKEELRLTYLRQIEQIIGAGHAEFGPDDEAEFALGFFPIPEHIRALDPNVALVLGDRGAGKTELFKAIQFEKIRPAIASRAPTERMRAALEKPIRWRVGFSGAGTDFPNAKRTREYFNSRDQQDAANFWYAYLVRSLYRDLLPMLNQSPARLTALKREPAMNIAAIIRDSQTTTELEIALDLLDEDLQVSDEYIIVSYDALDAFGGADQEVMSEGVRALLSFWTEHIRRWKRIKPKLFLRTDLFRTYADKLGADFAKLSSLRTEIAWNDRYLYSVLIKRLLNSGPDLRQFLQQSSRLKDIQSDPILGYTPSLLSIDSARLVIERLAGPYMGANPKKGATYRWVVDHVKDGNGRGLPRAFLQLFSAAARRELASARKSKFLIDWASLRQAMDSVSKDQVDQSGNEWPWMVGLRQRLTDQLVPMPQRSLERLISSRFDESWGEATAEVNVRPPAADAREMVAKLIELGVASQRGLERIDVPDLYSAGLGLKRHGGVRKI